MIGAGELRLIPWPDKRGPIWLVEVNPQDGSYLPLVELKAKKLPAAVALLSAARPLLEALRLLVTPRTAQTHPKGWAAGLAAILKADHTAKVRVEMIDENLPKPAIPHCPTCGRPDMTAGPEVPA